jgi:monofunctional biosynthetic peptidoglycan transglycosylase
MGGQSSSALAIADSALVFSGHVSLVNNGGFASVRSAVIEPRFADAKAIILRVMGDGKSYKINLKTDGSLDGVQYQARFQPGAGVWETVRLPFARFVATYRGRRVPEAPPLRSAEIRTVGLMISERQAGPFKLKVDWIGVELGVHSSTAKHH